MGRGGEVVGVVTEVVFELAEELFVGGIGEAFGHSP